MLQSVFKSLRTVQKLNARPVFSYLDYNDRDRRTTANVSNDNLPGDSNIKTETIESQEVISRLLKVASEFQEINIKQFDFAQNFQTLGLDSLNRVAYITSVEEEFNTIFPDRVFDNFDTPNDIKRYIESSIHSF